MDKMCGRSPCCAEQPPLPCSHCRFTFPSALCQGMVLAGNQPQAPAAAKPLPSVSSFTHQKFQRSAGYCSAWEALKMWLRTGTCIVFLLEKQKARLQGAVTSQEISALSTQMEPKGKKVVLELKFLIQEAKKPTCSSWGKPKKAPNTHIY